MSGNEKRSCAKVRWFQIRAQFLPQTTRALQAQPDCDEKWFNTRTANRNFLHEYGMHCQSTPDIESIIQDEFDVVKRQQNQWRKEKWQAFFPRLVRLLNHATLRSCKMQGKKVERLGRCGYDELCIERRWSFAGRAEVGAYLVTCQAARAQFESRRAPWSSLPTQRSLADRPGRMVLLEYDRRSCGSCFWLPFWYRSETSEVEKWTGPWEAASAGKAQDACQLAVVALVSGCPLLPNVLFSERNHQKLARRGH
jgi:hypothetical protein